MRKLVDLFARRCYAIMPTPPAIIRYVDKNNLLKGGNDMIDTKEIKVLDEANGIITYAEIDTLDRAEYGKLVAEVADCDAIITNATNRKAELESKLAKMRIVIAAADAKIAAETPTVIVNADAAQS